MEVIFRKSTTPLNNSKESFVFDNCLLILIEAFPFESPFTFSLHILTGTSAGVKWEELVIPDRDDGSMFRRQGLVPPRTGLRF